jgi:hypothetical protein
MALSKKVVHGIPIKATGSPREGIIHVSSLKKIRIF